MDWDDLADSYGEEWGHQEIAVAEPFAYLFRLRRTRRYDLLACMLRDLRLPKTAGWGTEQFLDHLYERVAAAYELDILHLDDVSVRELVFVAVWEIEDEAFLALVNDLGWDEKLKVTTTPSASSDDFRRAFAKRMTPRVAHLLRQHRRRRNAA